MPESTTVDAPYRVRCAFTPGSLAGVVTARKRRRCETHFSGVNKHYIEVGDQYVENALPPDNPDIGNTNWWHYRVCLDCCPPEWDPRIRDADQKCQCASAVVGEDRRCTTCGLIVGVGGAV